MYERIRTAGATAVTIFLAIVIPLVIVSGVASTGYADVPDAGAPILDHTETDQSWRMFAPNPLDTSRWYVGVGNTTSGRTVDPLLGGSPQLEKPSNPADTVRTFRWRKYLGRVASLTPTNRPDYLGNHLCERWNATHDSDLQEVSVYAMEQSVGPEGPISEPERDVVVRDYDCTGDLYQA